MKYFISKWETTSGNWSNGVAKDLADRSHWLTTSEGTYVHILTTRSYATSGILDSLVQEYVWEVVYQDEYGRWQEREDDEDTLEKAKGQIMIILLKAGYRAINGKCQVLE